MKTLYLVRHAKSSWEDLAKEDHERDLLPKGEKRTRRIVTYLRKQQVAPDLIVSSHALRAYATACILAEGLGYSREEILIDSQLYFSGAQAIENVVYGLPDNRNHVMLVGHNPDMTRFANVFLDEKVDYMPTSAVVCIRFMTDKWENIMMAAREIPFVVFPKDL